jgi:hypothetical protein
MRLGVLGQLQEVAGVAAGEGSGRTGRVQPLPRVLADRPSRASRATWASWAVSSRMVSAVRLRAVSPVAASQFWWPIAVAAATGVTHYFVGAIAAHLRG